MLSNDKPWLFPSALSSLAFEIVLLLKISWKDREGEDAGRSPGAEGPPLRRRNSARCLRISSSEVGWELEEERGGGGGGSAGIRRGGAGGAFSRSLISLNKEEYEDRVEGADGSEVSASALASASGGGGDGDDDDEEDEKGRRNRRGVRVLGLSLR